MRLRSDIRLYRLGKEQVVVNPGRNSERESYLYPMNEATAMLWEAFQGREVTVEAMADVLCEAYDVSRDVALHDIREMLQQWKDYELLA